MLESFPDLVFDFRTGGLLFRDLEVSIETENSENF